MVPYTFCVDFRLCYQSCNTLQTILLSYRVPVWLHQFAKKVVCLYSVAITATLYSSVFVNVNNYDITDNSENVKRLCDARGMRTLATVLLHQIAQPEAVRCVCTAVSTTTAGMCMYQRHLCARLLHSFAFFFQRMS